MAKLKLVMETLDAVPEALRDLYVECDGKFVLDVDEDVQALRQQIEQQERDILTSVAEREAVRAILAEDGEPLLLEPHVTARLRVARQGEGFAITVVDADGRPRQTMDGPLTPRDFVRELKHLNGRMAGAFRGTGASGSCAEPSGG